MAELVGGMQVLVDAALAHRTLDDILRELVTQVRGVLDADAATIYLADEEERLSVGARPRRRSPAETSSPAAWRKRARRCSPTDDPSSEGGRLVRRPAARGGRGHRRAGGVASAHAVRRRGRQPAAPRRRPRGPRHRPARVYEREHRIAETLQRSLLPDHLPQLPGLSVAARYLPAASEAEVGGDWYDVMPIPGGGVGLVMGDVAGKGLAAASMVGGCAARCAPTRSRGTRRRASSSSSTGCSGPRRTTARWRRCST